MNNLEYEIMCTLGFQTDENGFLIDQNYGAVVTMRDKFIKIVSDEEEVCNNVVKFDPINDMKMIKFLFALYLKKLEDGYDIYFPISYPININGKTKMEIKDSNGKVAATTEAYYNEALAYIDLIFRLDDKIMDLSNYDEPRITK